MNWQQVCENPDLQNLPYKIELNRQGQIIMSPASVKHVLYQARIIKLLNQSEDERIAVPEFPIETHEGVKVADVALLTPEQVSAVENYVSSAMAPLVCIEVLSPSNTQIEMNHKKQLYFEKGAEEFWLCDQNGDISFYDKGGQLTASQLVLEFPSKL